MSQRNGWVGRAVLGLDLNIGALGGGRCRALAGRGSIGQESNKALTHERDKLARKKDARPVLYIRLAVSVSVIVAAS